MLISMTGYGKVSSENENYIVEIDVKSVNNRFLDISTKLPSMLQNREFDIKELVKTKIARGKVFLAVSIKPKNSAMDIGSIDEDKLNAYVDQIKKIKKIAKLTETIKIDHLLGHREAILADSENFSENDYNFIASSILKALDNMLSMKSKEGKELERDLKARLLEINSRADEVLLASKVSVNENFERLKERVSLLLTDTSINPDRLDTEIALLADKADITEECVRLKSHIKFFIESMEKEKEAGRKLNFLCQELHREANTISAKSISTEIIHSAVSIKEEIEKIREQIQNIE